MLRKLNRDGLNFSAAYVDSVDSAPGVLKALAEHGFSVPEDVSLVCNDAFSQDTFPFFSLTTVGARLEAMAEAAIKGLEALFNGSCGLFRTEICAELIERKSVRNLALRTRTLKKERRKPLMYNLKFDFQQE